MILLKALITGVTGFVGQYLADFLVSQGVEVVGTTSQVSKGRPGLTYNDLNSESSIITLLDEIQPDQIFHLAGLSNVKESWDNKVQTISVNVNTTINLLEAIRKSAVAESVRILTVGSAEEYGKVEVEQLPINEDCSLNPANPYGISKAAISYLVKQYYHAYGLKIIHARPFNHIGPGQNLGFVTSDFAKRIVDIELGNSNPVFKVGNLSSQRDFLDVRDVVTAYYYLLDRGLSGEVYNICSSQPVAISDILSGFTQLARLDIEVITDSSLLRPIDFPISYGTNHKIYAHTGWQPRIPLAASLSDILDYWRALGSRRGNMSV